MTTKLIPAMLMCVVLTACSRSEPEAPPEAPPEANAAAAATSVRVTPTPMPSPSPIPTAVADPPPPPRDVAADEQMIDDASATGMTARVQRDEDASGEPNADNVEEP